MTSLMGGRVRFFALVVGLVLQVGCFAGPPIRKADIARVTPGISEADLEAILGKPNRILRRRDGSVCWVWVNMRFLTGHHAAFSLKNGKVIGQPRDMPEEASVTFLSWLDALKREDYVVQHPEYSQQIQDSIIAGKLLIGMGHEHARFLYGDPLKINTTTGRFGVHEQWVYRYDYLYFENGILASWQSSD